MIGKLKTLYELKDSGTIIEIYTNRFDQCVFKITFNEVEYQEIKDTFEEAVNESCIKIYNALKEKIKSNEFVISSLEQNNDIMQKFIFELGEY